MNEADLPVLWSWALHHCEPWLNRAFDRARVRAELRQLNTVSPIGYLFDIAGGEVRLAAKPDDLDHIERDAPGGLRSGFYRAFLQEVVDAWAPDLEASLCISMCDGGLHHPTLPTFCFQKTDNSPQILLPDFDFLWKAFYADEEFADPMPFEDKEERAVFVGATTGATITAAIAQALATPRLDAARFFQGDPAVRFELPVVVQCESDEVRQYLSRLPFCRGDIVPWREQLGYKYLISMDGNGATCSRVTLSLKSNSVLLKYRSPWKLYYFDFMRTNVHYIDIARHQDVRDLVRFAGRWPGVLAPAAEAGRAFADRFLSRDAVAFYMAALLGLYEGSVLGGRAPDTIFDQLVRRRALS